MFKANFPSEVKQIFQIFNSDSNQDKIRLVGGCVRDLLLQKQVHDFDFVTKYNPQEIIKILQKNNIKFVNTGIKFGTIVAVINGKNFEITTLRKEIKNDGRKCEVEFIQDYSIDASRRDFTINAISLTKDGKIYDYFDGIKDLKNKKVRFIGDANLRIKEDFLRILRFFRFSVEYAKNIDQKSLDACIKNIDGLSILSKERIRQETLKILSSSNYKNLLKILKILNKSKISKKIFLQEIQLKNLEKLFKIFDFYNLTPSINLILLVAFFDEYLDKKIENLSRQICLTKKEKKYFQVFFSKRNYFSIKNPTKKINFILSCFQRFEAIEFYLFYCSVRLKKINFKTISKHLSILKEKTLPEFPIKSNDFISLINNKNNISKINDELRIYWINSNFSLDKNQLMKYGKNLIKKYNNHNPINKF